MNTFEFEVLNILGLGVEPTTHRLFDIDKGVFLIYNGNYIYTDESVIIHKRDTKFDLLGNMKLAEYMFNVMLKKEEEENGLYIQMISTLEDSSQQYIKRAIAIRTNIGEFKSNFFYNMSLPYIQLIYILSGTPASFNLGDFDFTLKQLNAMYGKKKGSK